MDRGARLGAVHEASQSWTRQSEYIHRERMLMWSSKLWALCYLHDEDLIQQGSRTSFLVISPIIQVPLAQMLT